jgi:hypothetical protein
MQGFLKVQSKKVEPTIIAPLIGDKKKYNRLKKTTSKKGEIFDPRGNVSEYSSSAGS